MRFCTKCVAISERPRVSFDDKGVCNGCQWTEVKKASLDWKKRRQQLEQICAEYRRTDGNNWDVIVPCSGGKDGSYVAWKLKHDFGMHPLCITIIPTLLNEIGRKNLDNFKKSGFDHISITPNPQIYERFSKKLFREQGRPKHAFELAVSTAIIRLAINFQIPFIMFGEEGEAEYGGAMTQAYKPKIDRKYLVKYYYSGHDPAEYLNEFTKEELKWWFLPSQEELDKVNLYPAHWSHFENWDCFLHLQLAKAKCGHQGLKHRSVGTFTKDYNLDDDLNDLHHYMKFIKFGFGRASSDAQSEIRAGRITREEGVEFVKKYDGEFPEQYLQAYLKFFGMTEGEFWKTVDSFANTKVLQKKNDRWRLKPQAIKGLEDAGEFIV